MCDMTKEKPFNNLLVRYDTSLEDVSLNLDAKQFFYFILLFIILFYFNNKAFFNEKDLDTAGR